MLVSHLGRLSCTVQPNAVTYAGHAARWISVTRRYWARGKDSDTWHLVAQHVGYEVLSRWQCRGSSVLVQRVQGADVQMGVSQTIRVAIDWSHMLAAVSS